MRFLVNYTRKIPLRMFDPDADQFAQENLSETAELDMNIDETDKGKIDEIYTELWQTVMGSMQKQLDVLKQHYKDNPPPKPARKSSGKKTSEKKKSTPVEDKAEQRMSLRKQMSKDAETLGWNADKLKTYGANLLEIAKDKVDGSKLSMGNLEKFVAGVKAKAEASDNSTEV